MKRMLHARNRLSSLANSLAIALAASLPWSTSATSIFAFLWLLAFIPTCDFTTLRRVVSSPTGGLPLLLVALSALGMLWADVSWAERADGLSSFIKLLFIPLLLCQFSQSDRAAHALIVFLGSCVLLLICSWALFIWPWLPAPSSAKTLGVPVKDYISQGAMFTICIFVMARFAVDFWVQDRRLPALGSAVLGIIFLANVFYIATSRTSLVVIAALVVVFGARQLTWKGMVGLVVGLAVLTAVVWPSASHLRLRVITLFHEVDSYRPEGQTTSAGERMEFWRKSVSFIKEAPIVGHGTGSIRELFEHAAKGKTGMAAEISVNPHNQILAVGIQLGFLGIGLLLAMWIAHLALFRTGSFAAWVGLVVVVQNIVGSLFNSHLFDFTHGWVYVVGFGIAGGAVLKGTATIER